MTTKATSKDSLGDRMKDHENRTRYFLPKRTFTIIRLDGKSFHTFTRGCQKPFDKTLMECMTRTTLKLCEEIQNCRLGYTQSDEITLVLTDFDNRRTEQWFDGNIQKIVSVSSAIATAEFNKQWLKHKLSVMCSHATEHSDVLNLISDITPAYFDSRVYTVSESWEAFNAVLWRQNDASENSIHMVSQSLYPHGELQNKNLSQLQEMIHKKGQNWNDYPTDCKRGTFVVRDGDGWKIDKDGPILTQDRFYFFSKVPQYDQYDMTSELIEQKEQ